MRVEDLVLPAPLQFQDQIRVNIHALGDYAATSTGLPRLDRGFNIKGAVDGEYEVITLAAFRRKLFDKTSGVTVANPFRISLIERNALIQSIKADSTVASRTIQLGANQWNDCALVFVERTGAADVTIDIGII